LFEINLEFFIYKEKMLILLKTAWNKLYSWQKSQPTAKVLVCLTMQKKFDFHLEGWFKVWDA